MKRQPLHLLAVAALLTVAATASAPANTASIAAALTQCAYASGATAGGFGSAGVCTGAGSDSASAPEPSGFEGYGCIELYTDAETLAGCGPVDFTSLIVEPVLGTATMSFSVPEQDRPDVMLHAAVTLVAWTPPFPSGRARHDAALDGLGAEGFLFADASASRGAVTGPGSTITSSVGHGGQMEIASEGGFENGVMASADFRLVAGAPASR